MAKKEKKPMSEDGKQIIEWVKLLIVISVVLFLIAIVGNVFAEKKDEKKSKPEQTTETELISGVTYNPRQSSLMETKLEPLVYIVPSTSAAKPTEKITESKTTNPPKAETTEEETERPTEPSTQSQTEPPDEPEEYESSDALYSPSYFKQMGVIYWNGWRWTWYSERVLPGTGLHIPGRYTDAQGYVRDGDGYICVASDVLSKGTVISTPFGHAGKVYDCGCGSDTVDVYVGW